MHPKHKIKEWNLVLRLPNTSWKKPGQFSLLRHARLAGSGLCFPPESSHTLLLSCWMEKLIAKAKTISNLVWGIQIWNPLLELGWLILIYLNEPMVGRNPHRDSFSLLQCIFPTFSDLLYHFDWWLSRPEFFTLSLPQSPPLFPICLLTKRIAQRPHCSKAVIFYPEQSCLPGGIWKYLETFLVSQQWKEGSFGIQWIEANGHCSVSIIFTTFVKSTYNLHCFSLSVFPKWNSLRKN